ncbi:MAG: carboxypeptidase regulatory-like domain-containing protein [Myxococcales bacterium]|nr:carboxypeptidase regulatory-like domain-containing protein [Myxococcales bacterium]
MNLRGLAYFVPAFTAGALALGGCGILDGSLFGSSEDPPNDGNPNPSFTNTTGDGGANGEGGKPCISGLCKQQVDCGTAPKTSVSGKVHDPAGKVPLYNVLVYVPNATPAPITTGASCDRCGDVSGDPLVTALTDAKGEFRLDDVPVGKDIPLVIQVGKWRRQITIPNVEKCVDHPLSVDQLRLPRNQSEGDLPQMAIASGAADPFECLLTKMGIDEAEFTHDTGTGRVHYYRENGVDTSPSAPAASTLYNDLAKMKTYDIIFLPCEGSPRDKNDTVDQNLVDYTAVGGRAFTTHYGYVWLFNGVTPFPTTGDWQPRQSDKFSGVLNAQVNTGFPKGQAFAEWLVNVGASQQLGTMELREARHDLNAGNDPPSTTWMSTNDMPAPNNNAAMHITFNTPIGVPDAQLCGRVVYSDFHVSASAKEPGQPNFPGSCKKGDLSEQEKALEFMLFDLSSCIQNDKEPPRPPPPVIVK